MAMDPPTVTRQEKQVRSGKWQPVLYEPAELKAARAKLKAHLVQHRPERKYTKPVELGDKVVLPAGQAWEWSVPEHKAGYRQSAEAPERLYDGCAVLDGRRSGLPGDYGKVLGGSAWDHPD